MPHNFLDRKKKPASSSGGGYKPMTEREEFKPQEVQQETTRERAARQRRERQAELTFTQEDYDRWARNRERVIAERNAAALQAYELTEPEWNKDLQDNLKEYLEGRHKQVCILSVDDAAKCALNIWHQKNEDGETIGSETLKLLDDIHSKIDMGVGLIAAAKISKALGNFGITVKQYTDAKGIERVIISSLWNDPKNFYAVVNGLNIKKNYPYRITNPTIKQLGVLAEDTVNGFKKGAVLSLIVSATINTNELVFNDDYHLVDWCGSMGSDLFKLLVEGAVVSGIVYLTIAFGVAMPILVGAMIWVGVDIIVSNYWDKNKVEDHIINSLKEVTNAK